MRNGDEGVDKAGFLNKKSPSGVPGFRQWQKRWFVLGTKNKGTSARVLKYYKTETDKDPIATLPITKVVRVQLMPGKRKGCRFDITTDNSRVYALDALTPKDAKAWVVAIQEQIKNRNRQSIIYMPKGISGNSWTKFQDLFFKYKFGSEDVKKATAVMNEYFPSDAAILRYLIEKVLDPLDMFDGPELPQDSTLLRSLSWSGSVSLSDSKRSDFETSAPGSTLGETDAPSETLSSSKSGKTTAEIARLAERDKKLESEGNLELFKNVRTQEFIRNLLHIFGASDPAAHGLAVRCLWITLTNIYPPKEAAKQFSANVQIFCAEERYNEHIRDALFAILFTEPKDLISNIDSKIEATFYKPFKQPSILPAIFYALKGSNFSLRTKALEDFNTTLIGSLDNCNAILVMPEWQKLMMTLLTDIKRTDAKQVGERDPEEDQIMRKAYGYVMNVFAIVHFEKFAETDQFIPLLHETYDALFAFSGPADCTYQVGLVIATSLASKLKGKKGKQTFSTDDYASRPYQNLFNFCQFVKRFVFQIAHWRTRNDIAPATPSKFARPTTTPDTPELRRGDSGGGTPEKDEKHRGSSSPEKALADEAEFVLVKCRGKQNQSVTPFAECEEYGVHFNEKGECGDKALLGLLIDVIKSLNFDKFDSELHKDVDVEGKAFLLKMESEAQLLEDSLALLNVINRSGIVFGRITWRYLANVVQRHLLAGTPLARKAILEEVTSIMAGEKQMGGFASKITSAIGSEAPSGTPKVSIALATPKSGGTYVGTSTSPKPIASPKSSVAFNFA